MQGEGHKHTRLFHQHQRPTRMTQKSGRSQVGWSQGVHSFSETTSRVCFLRSRTLWASKNLLQPSDTEQPVGLHKARPQSGWAFSVLTGRPIRVTKKSRAIKETTEMCWRSWEDKTFYLLTCRVLVFPVVHLLFQRETLILNMTKTLNADVSVASDLTLSFLQFFLLLDLWGHRKGTALVRPPHVEKLHPPNIYEGQPIRRKILCGDRNENSLFQIENEPTAASRPRTT